MSTDLEIRDESLSQVPANLFGTSDPAAVVEQSSKIASALKSVLTSKGLAKQISGREFVMVEGWTLLGTMLGVFPVVEWTRPLTKDGQPHGWEARVEARTLNGQVVGAAEAECTRDENHWSWAPTSKYGKTLEPRDDYALRSMAQTRAVSKALRGPLGFIVQLAGYEATPAEEMPSSEAVTSSPPTPASDTDLTRLNAVLNDLSAMQPPEGWADWVSFAANWARENFAVSGDGKILSKLSQERVDKLADTLDTYTVPL